MERLLKSILMKNSCKFDFQKCFGKNLENILYSVKLLMDFIQEERTRIYFCVFWIKWSWRNPALFKFHLLQKLSCGPACKCSDRSDQEFLRKIIEFVRICHFRKTNCKVVLSRHIEASNLLFLIDGFSVLFSIFFPNSSFVTFFKVEKLLFFDQKRPKLSYFKSVDFLAN